MKMIWSWLQFYVSLVANKILFTASYQTVYLFDLIENKNIFLSVYAWPVKINIHIRQILKEFTWNLC